MTQVRHFRFGVHWSAFPWEKDVTPSLRLRMSADMLQTIPDLVGYAVWLGLLHVKYKSGELSLASQLARRRRLSVTNLSLVNVNIKCLLTMSLFVNIEFGI